MNFALFFAWCKQHLLFYLTLLFLGFCVVVSVLPYAFMPDDSPNANTILPEIAAKPMGYKVDILYLKDANNINGEPSRIPLQSYNLKGDSLYYFALSEQTAHPIAVPKSMVTEVKSTTFPFGTDNFGRDMLSRLLLGTRISLSVGFIAVFIAVLIGTFLGAIAGYFGGWYDKIILWLISVVWALPTLLLVVAITFALGKGFWQIFFAIGLSTWVEIARLVRGQVMSVSKKEYVEAAKVLGYGPMRTIFRHILPNIIGPITVMASANFASAILLEAGLSFLGFGVQPPIPSWGGMIKEHYSYILTGQAYLALVPGIAIVLLVFSFNVLSIRLRKKFDYIQTETLV